MFSRGAWETSDVCLPLSQNRRKLRRYATEQGADKIQVDVTNKERQKPKYSLIYKHLDTHLDFPQSPMKPL